MKSFVPIVTAGLPLPGWSAAWVEPELPPPPLSSSPPQPATTNAITSSASSESVSALRLPCMHLPPVCGSSNDAGNQTRSAVATASVGTASADGTIVCSSRGTDSPRGVTARWAAASSMSTAKASATTTIVAAITPTSR